MKFTETTCPEHEGGEAEREHDDLEGGYFHEVGEADEEGEREASVEGFVQQGRSDCGEAEEDEEGEEPEEEEGEFFHG